MYVNKHALYLQKSTYITSLTIFIVRLHEKCYIFQCSLLLFFVTYLINAKKRLHLIMQIYLIEKNVV